jgi:hypothetical protein
MAAVDVQVLGNIDIGVAAVVVPPGIDEAVRGIPECDGVILFTPHAKSAKSDKEYKYTH